MKIKSVEIWNTNCNDTPAWHPVLIRINTDEGISGVGEVGVAYGIGTALRRAMCGIWPSSS